jgi:hypothetical protein
MVGVPVADLINIRVKTIHTHDPSSSWLYCAFGLTLNDGQHAKTATFDKVNNDYMMPATPLKEIIITYHMDDDIINHLILVYADGTTKRLGMSYSDGRVDRYVFEKDEHLIGATIEH